MVYDKADMLHVSGHACQEELKIIHALTKPRFFIPLHGEQRMLQIHKRVAESMGMDPNNICVAENGSVIELTTKHMKCEASVPAGEVFVDGSGWGEWEPWSSTTGSSWPRTAWWSSCCPCPPTITSCCASRRSSPGALYM